MEVKMAFDGPLVMTRLEKLMRLYELLGKMTDRQQADFNTCLWPKAMDDAVLRAANMPKWGNSRDWRKPDWPSRQKYRRGLPRRSPETLSFLGIHENSKLWSDRTVVHKRKILMSMIKRERAKQARSAMRNASPAA
jgi:hypothetical protein